MVCAALLRVVVVTARATGTVNTNSMDYATFSPLYDAARCAPLLRYRLYFFEELLVTTLLMLCDGIRPREGNCGYMAVAVASVTVFHFIFLIAVRPYECEVELGCSLLSAAVLVGIGVLAVVATLGTATPAVLDALGYLVLVESVVVFVQIGALALHAYVVGQKKKFLERQTRVAGSSASLRGPQDDDSDDPNAVPLLAIPDSTTAPPPKMTTGRTATTTSNPLLQF